MNYSKKRSKFELFLSFTKQRGQLPPHAYLSINFRKELAYNRDIQVSKNSFQYFVVIAHH